ncbi:hypothetical protein HY641_02870 [Candidatus Woesearchaeota archaeon]|nr:hypothetical protein [Candidatus Woesearchaeota archaeon]
MEEHRIKWVAVVVSVLGLGGMYVVGFDSQSTPMDTTFTGRVVSMSQTGDLTIIKVSKVIPVVLKDKVIISCGSLVQFDGSYDDYEGKSEFRARSFSIIKEGKGC